MYICLCKAITGADISTAVERGARSQRDLAHQLGVGLGCGRCVSCARALLSETVERIGGGCNERPLTTQGAAS